MTYKIDSVPKNGTWVVFYNDKTGTTSNAVRWVRKKLPNIRDVSERFEDKKGRATGLNDETAWTHWFLVPGPGEAYEIKHVALRFSDGTVVTELRPARHHDLIQDYWPKSWQDSPEQGFWCEEYGFMNRYKAMAVAFQYGQVSPDKLSQGELFSEDLW